MSGGVVRHSVASAATVFLPVTTALWMVLLLLLVLVMVVVVLWRVRLAMQLRWLLLRVMLVVHRNLLRGRAGDKRHLHRHGTVCQSARAIEPADVTA